MADNDEKENLKSSWFSQEVGSTTDLLETLIPVVHQRQPRSRSHPCLYITVILQFIALSISMGYMWKTRDPKLAIWCRLASL